MAEEVRALGAPTVQMRRPGLMHEPLRTLRKAEGGCLQLTAHFDHYYPNRDRPAAARGGEDAPHGIGDILEKVIWQRGTLHPNIHILYNYMDLGDDLSTQGLLQGFKAPLIHIFNKNSAVGSSANYFRQLQGRTNILLLGDSLGDRSMADGVPGVQDILKVGFLNDKVEQQRERYLEAYDAVLESDEMLDVVNGLLQHILCPGGHEDTPEQVYHGAQAHLPPLPLPPCLLPKTHVGRLVEAFVKKPHFSPIEGHTAVS
ncbi:7-methylguanosine phosphate-specific 5'-nucleotidase isoform X1 [Cavia porcellus]|uniref:7-methylguanosine phosphate-specific 5'-nucleotidase isoform X1 n=1 Tax=Cavia porcellus TaxID=10141 RepID=UPI002FE2898F